MNKALFYTMIACALLVSSCSPKKESLQPRRTVIAGVVENFPHDDNALLVNYCDPLSDKHRFAQNLTKSNGSFHTTHDYLFAQNLTIRLGGKFISLFVNPGDSVFVKIDAGELWRDFDKAVTFSGDNAGMNAEINGWVDYWYQAYIPEFDYTAPAEELQALLSRDFAAARDSIEAYSARTGGMSRAMKDWAYLDHKFLVANNMADFNNPDATQWTLLTGPPFDVFDEDNFHSSLFPYHLGYLCRVLIQSDTAIAETTSQHKFDEATRLFIRKLHEKAPEGAVRDVILYSFLAEAIIEQPEVWDAVPEIRTAFSQNIFFEKLASQVERYRENAPAVKSLLDEVVYLDGDTPVDIPSEHLLTYLTRKYTGKVLYIDIWATWCGPCIAQFKPAAELHRYFEGRDVVFVNLCLGSPFKDWQPGIARHNVDGENYFLGGNATALFLGEYNVSGYPTYMMVGKTGELYNSATVPRPSDTESAIRQLESLLQSTANNSHSERAKGDEESTI